MSVRNYVDPDGKRWTFALRWTEIGGRYEPTHLELHANGAPMSASAIRDLPLGGILAEERRKHLRRVEDAARWRELTAKHRKAARDDATKWGSHRGVPVTEEELERVVLAYRAAYVQGQPVTAAVAEALAVSTSTAGKRIMRARKWLRERGEEL